MIQRAISRIIIDSLREESNRIGWKGVLHKFTRGESEAIKLQESVPINLWTKDFSGEKLLPALIKTYKFQEDYRYLMIFFPPALRGSVDLDVRLLSEAID